MSRCPLCEDVLINPFRCDCGWRKLGGFTDCGSGRGGHAAPEAQNDSSRYCHMPDCQRNWSVKLNDGRRLCSECWRREANEERDEEGVERLRGNLMMMVQSWRQKGALNVRRGTVTTQVVEEAHKEIERLRELRRPKQEDDHADDR